MEKEDKKCSWKVDGWGEGEVLGVIMGFIV